MSINSHMQCHALPSIASIILAMPGNWKGGIQGRLATCTHLLLAMRIASQYLHIHMHVCKGVCFLAIHVRCIRGSISV